MVSKNHNSKNNVFDEKDNQCIDIPGSEYKKTPVFTEVCQLLKYNLLKNIFFSLIAFRNNSKFNIMLIDNIAIK